MGFIPVCEPFLNGNEKKYVDDCLNTGWISSSGKYVKQFEEKFAEYCEAKYAVATTNGTTALHLALVALGIGENDEVIIPDFTMIASAFAVCYTGAKPVFVDADKDTWNIDVSKIESVITQNTKAIMPVSLFGTPCEMDKIMEIAQKHKLFIVEDAAQSHGAKYKNKKVGSIADITSFSFFANKNLTTGEGGMVVTNNEELYKKALYHKNLCFPLDLARNYIHNDIGFNYRISNIHAAIGLAQIEKADEYKEMRKKNAQLYKKHLEGIEGIIFQKVPKESESVNWMNAIIVDPIKFGNTKDTLINYLKDNNIDSRLLFSGMHMQPSLKKYFDKNKRYPVTEWLTNNGLYLPSASNLKESEIEYICSTIKKQKKG